MGALKAEGVSSAVCYSKAVNCKYSGACFAASASFGSFENELEPFAAKEAIGSYFVIKELVSKIFFWKPVP